MSSNNKTFFSAELPHDRINSKEIEIKEYTA